MSQENVEMVRRGLEHFRKTRDFLDQDFAKEFVWDMSTFRGWPEQKTYEGIEGAREFIRTWAGAWDEWELDIVGLHDAGDRVVAVMRQRGRAKSTGLAVDMTFAQVFTIEGGRETRMQMYADPAEALAALGLSE
jgi:ketosteroid isomerase-like protein